MGLFDSFKGLFANSNKKSIASVNQSAQFKDKTPLLDYIELHQTLKNCPNEFFTPEEIAKCNKSGQTALHLAAAKGLLKFFPDELFTPETLNKIDKNGNTVWHVAFDNAKSQGMFNKSIDSLPIKFLTKDILKQQNYRAQNVLFLAMNNLKHIPKDLITTEALNQCDNLGNTAWHLAAVCNSFKQIPTSVFPQTLFQLNKHFVEWGAFNIDVPYVGIMGCKRDELTKFRTYAEKVLLDNKNDTLKKKSFDSLIADRFDTFIQNNPSLKKDIHNSDPRLKLIEADSLLVFSFDSIDNIWNPYM